MNILSFKSINFGLIIILIFALSSCDFFKAKKEETKSYWPGVYLINVNDKESFNDAKIKGSIHMSFDDVAKKSKDLSKNDTIVVYCSDYSCTESDRVANELVKLGFNKVFVYPGGIQEWYQLSGQNSKIYPIDGPVQQPLLKKPIEKFERDGKIQSISAQDLSNLLKQSKENPNRAA